MVCTELSAGKDGSHIGPLSAPKLRGIHGVTVAGPFEKKFPVLLPPEHTPVEALVEPLQACLDTVDNMIDRMLRKRW